MYKKTSGFMNGRPLSGWSVGKHGIYEPLNKVSENVRHIYAEEKWKIHKKFKGKRKLTKEEHEKLLKEWNEKNGNGS